MNIRWLWLTAALLPALAAAEPGTALKDDTLRQEPFADARPVGTIKRHARLDILERKGAWLKVKADGKSGWIRLLSVKRGGATPGSTSDSVLGLASGRAGTGQVVSTTGVRGLSEEELRSARFDEAQVVKLENLAVSAPQARQFALEGDLQARSLDDLPNPTQEHAR